MTTIERVSPEQEDQVEHPAAAEAGTTGVDTAAADDTEFEPTIIRGRE